MNISDLKAIEQKTYNVIDRLISTNDVLDLPLINHILYCLKGKREFITADEPRVVVSSCKVCESGDKEASPCIVVCGARR